MFPVRREHDDELEGFVVQDLDGWQALTVFHGVLGRAPTREAAVVVVHRRGLASLAERWYWRPRYSGEWQVVVPQESRPGWVRVAIGYYSLPGVETAIIRSTDLEAGDRLTLAGPDDSGGA